MRRNDRRVRPPFRARLASIAEEPEKPLRRDRLALPPPPCTPKKRRHTAFVFDGWPMATRPIDVLRSIDPNG